MSFQQNIASAQVITTTSQSRAIPSPPDSDDGTFGIELNVTAVSGTTPSMTVTVQWSNDGTNFFAASPADSFAAITAVGGVVQNVAIKAPWYRLNYAVTGTTPSFTLTADAYSE